MPKADMKYLGKVKLQDQDVDEMNTFQIEADEGSSPYKKAATDEEIEEERRLFYVAMTRAKRKLIISYVKEKNGKDMTPSRFVSELLFDV